MKTIIERQALSVWRLKYINRLVKMGWSRAEAKENFDAGNFDLNNEPMDCADDELSYHNE